MRRCLLAALGLFVAGCTLSSSAQMRFAPTSVERPASPFSTELTRTCVVDDCRTQTVQLRMPDGESMTGQLRFLSGAVAAGEGTSVGIGWTTPGVASQERRPAVMTLTGDRGSRLTCELLFSTGTRHASGLCRAPSGASYAVSL
jgi:hypothetical protein